MAGRKIQLFAATKPGITLTQLGPLVLRSIALATVVSALLLLLPLSSIVCYRWQSAQNPSEIRLNPSWHLINVLPSEPLAPCNTFASRNELEMYVCQRAYFIGVLTLDPRPFRILAIALRFELFAPNIKKAL